MEHLSMAIKTNVTVSVKPKQAQAARNVCPVSDPIGHVVSTQDAASHKFLADGGTLDRKPQTKYGRLCEQRSVTPNSVGEAE